MVDDLDEKVRKVSTFSVTWAWCGVAIFSS